ncbi:natural killer cells antigen CD94 isoform X1 [Ailuropoda melanoleuca]|uniref:Natural killer cells antigen CD94 n=2 Tax=Ailuropoda melanoleuca TaxID=9646 RepID=G1LD93_AILME|nr:natural killer cells antigen CD94 isoform X1 [Ailuropoda melanoleuca]XP_019648957.1 natural killer cells antigen CD94 isoform X1 [Ailuropoda melanoleuca]
MKASQTTPWNLISGILGVTCLLLMATMGILLKNLYSKQSIQRTFSPDAITELQKGSSCCSCPEKWIGDQCNCYFFSGELKTWKESRDFCASQNSSLLQIQNGEKLHFAISSTYYYWIGLSYHKERSAWLWEDGSTVSQDLLPLVQGLRKEKCVMYSSARSVLDEPCEEKYRFICERKLI